jgi:hypothetical protein
MRFAENPAISGPGSRKQGGRKAGRKPYRFFVTIFKLGKKRLYLLFVIRAPDAPDRAPDHAATVSFRAQRGILHYWHSIIEYKVRGSGCSGPPVVHGHCGEQVFLAPESGCKRGAAFNRVRS